ncbi:hypothetical protein F2P79_011082 [Pimephales promelas]|nr:hypothetical protein F2P79_011082 [Pimephales promelas]
MVSQEGVHRLSCIFGRFVTKDISSELLEGRTAVLILSKTTGFLVFRDGVSDFLLPSKGVGGGFVVLTPPGQTEDDDP